MIQKINILFLCTGNICRSPTAEGIFVNRIKQEKLEKKFFVDSAGTHGYHEGDPPDLRAQKECKKHNIDLSKIKSRKLNDEDLSSFDYIIAMDKIHYDFVQKKHNKSNCTLLLNYTKKIKIIDVPDPYYGNEESFIETFKIINEGIIGLIKELKKIHNI